MSNFKKSKQSNFKKTKQFKISMLKRYFYSLIALNAMVLTVLYFTLDIGGNGVLKTETIQIDQFNHVTLEGIGTAHISKSNSPFLEVTANENILPLLKISVEEGNLKIRNEEDAQSSVLLLRIGSPGLQGITLVGNSTIEVPDVTGESFSISITDHGTAEVSGKINKLAVEIKGNGSVRATNLVARHAEIEITGKGDIQVHATDSLLVNCSGRGNVRYTGQPVLTNNCKGVIKRIK